MTTKRPSCTQPGSFVSTTSAPRAGRWFATLALLLVAAGSVGGAIPFPDKLVPDDTLVLLTAPDFSRLQELSKKAPLVRCWNDSAMKPFREKFVSKWTEDFVKPLERELEVKFANYTPLLRGQVTLAITQNGWQGGDDQEPALLVLVDTKDKADQLKKNLVDLRNKWRDAGKKLRTEKIRDIEFCVLPLTTNDVPKTLRKFFPKSSPVEELGDDKDTKKGSKTDELFIGQVDTLLILSDSAKAAEKIVARAGGGSTPALSEVPAYLADHQALFRESSLYGWINAKVLLGLFLRQASEKKENPDAPNPFDLKPEKIMSAAGLDSLKTIAVCFQPSNEGELLQFFLGVPESARQGLFKILAGEGKDAKPPAFVPADAVKFRRWRVDGQKTWAALQKMANDISPQFLSGVNFFLDTANTAAKDKDPGFDIRKNLIGNIGDDLIVYEKSSRSGSGGSGKGASALFLLGSPNADQMAAALRSILVFFSQQAGSPPDEREFLGRKIYSVQLGAMGLPTGAGGSAGSPRTLNYAASGGYLAVSTDSGVLEEYLRKSDSQGKTLRETPGLDEAAQKVLGSGSSLFGYQNESETMRNVFDALRKSSSTDTNAAANLLSGPLGLPNPAQDIKEWMDFSLLPEFDKVSKYFGFSVYGGSATTEGLVWKLFYPMAPGMRSEQH